MMLALVGFLSVVCIAGVMAEADSVKIVRDGKAASIIVLADKPSDSAKLGAVELQSWLEKATGAKVPIMSESQIPKDTDNALILVGDTERTGKLGIRSDDFQLEEMRIRTFPNTLVLIGDDRRPDGVDLSGTLWAVEAFAEKFLGVRSLWPGKLGEVVPKVSTVEIDDVDIKHIPFLRQRKIRNIGYSDRIQTGLDKLGWSGDEFKKHHEEAIPWFRFHRLGGSFHGTYGHAYGEYWKRFHEEHPEWFALQPDGTRDNSRAENGARSQLCVSNQDLIKQVAQDCITKLRNNPYLDTVSISPNDGSRVTFCLCESCESWDAPEGEMVEMWGPNGKIPHVSLTDRYVKFYSAVAEIVTKEFPDRYLGAYAYSAYSLPPVHAKLHPNVVIGFVGFSYLTESARQKAQGSWTKWADAASQIFLRPNLLMAGLGFPTIYVHRLAEDIRFCADNKMLFTDFDCCYQNWATDGLNYYVLAKLLNDPYADVDEIVDDYCRAGFGNAAESVREYFRQMEDMTTELALSNVYKGRKENPEALAQFYSDELLARCNAILDEAMKKAGEDEIIQKRIEFLRKAVEFARIHRDWTLAKALSRKGDSEAAQRLKTIEAEREGWYQRLGISWEINAPNLKFYGY